MTCLKTIGVTFGVTFFLLSCTEKNNPIRITVANPLDFDRTFETVELDKQQLNVENLDGLGVFNTQSKQWEVTQTVDNDGDSIADVLLFQPKIKANSEIVFEIKKIAEAEIPDAPEFCYSRFVPERTDDYTWENNKVAFRVYGPTAQRLKEEGDPTGTLSSGVDAWLKKVEYPIINKWYKKTTEGTGSYHKDTGEGLDNFHIGISRGVGGIAVKTDTTYYYSKNYTAYRTIATGPIRTSFYLEYANWDAGGKPITESMVVSLDLGQNLSKFKISITGTDTVEAGLTLHENDGEVSGNAQNGWVSYWQPHAKSELGTGIVAANNYFSNYTTYVTPATDESNAYATLKVIDNTVEYYAGFGWKESGEFNSKQDWELYLDTFSKCLKQPLLVKIEQ
ncbi:MAG: DUF4861 family protein [Flavobacteriaceae bacterium]